MIGGDQRRPQKIAEDGEDDDIENAVAKGLRIHIFRRTVDFFEIK
jgi:hypothetical protein